MQTLKNLVAGEWLGSDQTWIKTSPFDGRPVATVHAATREMVDRAVNAGKAAAFGDWGRMPIRGRVAILRDLHRRLTARLDDLIDADMADTGRSRWQASNFDGARAIGPFESYCDLALSLENRSGDIDLPGGVRGLWLTRRRPKGVIACIAPWNVPLLMMSLKTAPALVMGNAVIAKPSEETPSSATVLAEVIKASDLPDGAFSLLHGFGAGATGEFITTHPGVDAISFTGEPGTGSHIMKAAATGLREVAMELGGKNAALIFDDADMDRVIEGTIRSAFFNSGQICFCTERVLVHRSRHDEFLERMIAAANQIVIGEPDHKGFSIGPLVSQAHRAKVMELMDTVIADGGRFVAGGTVPVFGDDRDKGAFLRPTIVTGLGPDARFNREELFGPVMHVAPFDTEAEAIAMANDTRYGLATVLWTENINRALRVAPQIRVGHAWINSWQMRDLNSPLTGAGISGVGEQFGRSSLEFCSQPQTITVRVFD